MRLGPFIVDDPLASGAMGQVWAGHHEELGVPVAIKVMNQTGARFREAFAREVRAAARLNHPNIVDLYDHGELSISLGAAEPGSPYLVMERASGTLVDRPPDRPRSVLLQLLDALAHAHAHGVIHRDLKPANVLACGPETVRPGLKLADFGIAAEGGEVGRAGTPGFMAPEQARGSWRDLGPWTDLYALGRLATWMWVGNPSRDGDLPSPVAHWVRRLLEPDPGARFRTAAEAAVALPDWEGELARGAVVLPTLSVLTATEVGTRLVDTPPLPSDVATSRPPVRTVLLPEQPPLKKPPTRRLLGAGLALYGLIEPPTLHQEALEILWSEAREALHLGVPAHLAVQGPSGVGTQALLDDLATRLAELGAVQIWRVSEGGGLADAVAEGLRVQGLVGVALKQRLERQFSGRPQDEASVRALLDPDHSPLQITRVEERYAAVASALRAAAVDRPVFLLGPDPRFPEWLKQAAEPFPLLTGSLGGGPRLVPVSMQRLARMLRDWYVLEPATATALADQAGGRPASAIHRLRLLARRGALVDGSDGFRLDEAALPKEQFIAPWDEEIGSLAVQLGPRLSVEDLRTVTELLGRSFDPWSLAEADFLEPAGDGVFLVDPQVMESDSFFLPEVHRVLAEVVPDERAGIHWIRAEEPVRARKVLKAAAERATVGGDWGRAELLLRQRAHACTSAEIGENNALLAGVLRHAGRYDEARALASEAADDDDPDVAARAHRVILRILWTRGRLEPALKSADKALARVEDPAMRALLLNEKADLLRDLGRLDEAIEVGESSVAAFSALPEPHLGAPEPMMGLAFALEQRGELERARSFLEEAETTYTELGCRPGLASCRNALGDIARVQGDLEAAEAAYEDALELFRAVGSGSWPYPQLNLGLVRLERGDPDRARPPFEDCLRWFVYQDREGMAAATRICLLACAASVGERERFRALLEQGREGLESTGFVEADIARAAEHGMRAARTAGDEEGAAEARALALAQWEALGREDEVDRLHRE